MILTYLSKIPYLKDTKKLDLLHLSKRCMETNFKKGDAIIHEGDKPESLKIVKSGFVTVYGTNNNGDQSVLQILGENSSILESSVLLKKNYIGTVKAIEDTCIISIGISVLEEFLQSDISHMQAFMNHTLRCYQNTLEKMGCIQMQTASDKIGWFLLTQYVDSKNEGLVVKLPYDKSIIASYLNMTPETFSRAIRKFKENGYIVSNNMITIPRQKELCDHCTQPLVERCQNHLENPRHCPKEN